MKKYIDKVLESHVRKCISDLQTGKILITGYKEELAIGDGWSCTISGYLNCGRKK